MSSNGICSHAQLQHAELRRVGQTLSGRQAKTHSLDPAKAAKVSWSRPRVVHLPSAASHSNWLPETVSMLIHPAHKAGCDSALENDTGHTGKLSRGSD